jgi:lipoyl(octanoyl) transferase
MPDAIPEDMESGVEWRASPGLTDYQAALTPMNARADAVRAGTQPELVWLLQHPPLFTAGTSADPAELFNPQGFPVHEAGRGGRYTYHGPGQRVGYVVLDLDRRGRDVRRFVHALEGWMIAALGALGVEARRAEGRIGIWVDTGGTEAKIGAIGVRVRRWTTTHGFAINVDPELSHFSGIVPCGIAQFPVTSLSAIGLDNVGEQLDLALRQNFADFLRALNGAHGRA